MIHLLRMPERTLQEEAAIYIVAVALSVGIAWVADYLVREGLQYYLGSLSQIYRVVPLLAALVAASSDTASSALYWSLQLLAFPLWGTFLGLWPKVKLLDPAAVAANGAQILKLWILLTLICLAFFLIPRRIEDTRIGGAIVALAQNSPLGRGILGFVLIFMSFWILYLPVIYGLERLSRRQSHQR